MAPSTFIRILSSTALAIRPTTQITSRTSAFFTHSSLQPIRMSSSSSSSSSTTNNNTPHSNTDHTKTDQSEPHKPMLTLPTPGDAEPGMNLEVNGKDIKLDILGPVGKPRSFHLAKCHIQTRCLIHSNVSCFFYYSPQTPSNSRQRERHHVPYRQLGRNGRDRKGQCPQDLAQEKRAAPEKVTRHKRCRDCQRGCIQQV